MLRLTPRDSRPFTPKAAAALRPYTGVTARLLYARGIDDAAQADAFLHPSLSQLHDPMLMHGMDKATAIIQKAKAEGLATVVYGDYDVDGICAASLLTLALRRYGVNAQPHVPLREEGYGLNLDAVRALAQEYKLLITVDLGITNHEEVRLAQSLGMTVIVTDHHGLALEKSPADAVMNPLLGDYPYRRLCGTGVAFKLAQALLGIDACEEYLDLAALATVADIVPLTGENRVLVALGLPVIEGRKRPGIKALLAVSGDPARVEADTLGYQLGPRLNAAGRIGDAGKGVQLMMTDDPAKAQALAEELDGLNVERRSAESKLLKAAETAALKHDFLNERALIVTGDGWHVGVIGLAAGRLCQKYFCPVCVLSREDGLLHGSLRSVPGVHIHNCLKACDDLLLRYGGHELAAGVTLKEEKEAAFRERLQAEVMKADPQSFIPAQPYDDEVRLSGCTDALYRELSLLAPFGCDNPAPLLRVSGVCPEERRAVGAEGAHLKLTLRQDNTVMGGIAFSMGSLATTLPDKVDTVFSLGLNTFRGITSLQAEVKAMLSVRQRQEEAFQAPDGTAEEAALLNALLMMPSREAGLEQAALPLETPADFKAALAAHDRGILAVAHTHAAALMALKAYDLDIAIGAPTDPRGFHTLLVNPARELLTTRWAQVWLLDGELYPGEAALWQRQTGAEVHALPMSHALRALCAKLDAGDESCRAFYKTLRRSPCRYLREGASAAGMTDVQARTAMHAFHQLKLITYVESPFAYTLLPAAPCKLGDSPLLHAIRCAAYGKDDAT